VEIVDHNHHIFYILIDTNCKVRPNPEIGTNRAQARDLFVHLTN